MDWNRDSISSFMSGGGSNTKAELGWSWAEDKTFENALVTFSEDSPDRWENIARLLPGRSLADILVHYEILVADVADIEADYVGVPDYPEFPEAGPIRSNRSRCERTKGEPWTIEEHKLVLQGLEMFGKSDWRKTCRRFLPGRLPTQVASHAQKFFNRQKAGKKDGMRASIHDLASVSECEAMLEGRSNDATTTVIGACARPSPSLITFDASQGRSNDASTATTANADAYARPSPSLIISDAYPFSQGRSNNVATAVTDAYGRPSPSLITFDDSPFSQGRSNDVATTTTTVTDAYGRPSPSLITFDTSAFSQGRSNDAATIATTITDAYARHYSPSMITSDASAFPQGRSNDAATVANTITGSYGRPSPSLITFDTSALAQGRSNDAATVATNITNAYARPSQNMITFDAYHFSQGRSNDVATAAATVTDAYAVMLDLHQA